MRNLLRRDLGLFRFEFNFGGEINLKTRAFAGLGLQDDESLMTLDDGLGGKEPKTRALACPLGREESIEDVSGQFGRHSGTGIGYSNDYIGPWKGSLLHPG